MAEQTIIYEKGKLYDLQLNQIQTDPNQPRKYIDPQALEELAASVAKHGILEPILFRQDEAGNLCVVAGERRFQAAKQAGVAAIPAMFVDGNHAEIALVENLVRQDLTAVEEAEALQSLMTEQSYTQEQLAGIIGKARSTINDILTLTRLPQEIRDECRGSTIVTRKTLIEIARKKQTRGMITAWNKYKEKVAKEAEGRKKQTKVAESADSVLKSLIKTASKLSGLDTSSWTADEKSVFNKTLLDLQTSIQALLMT